MRFRGILFLATLAVALSPGAAALADEQVLTFDLLNDLFASRPFGLITAGVEERGYSFEATVPFEGFQLEFCGQQMGTPTDDVILDLYTASEAACEMPGFMSCRDTLIQSAVFTFTTPDVDFGSPGFPCAQTADTGVVVLAGEQAAGEYSINIRRSGALDDLDFWLLSAQGAFPAPNGIDGTYATFFGNPLVFPDRLPAANLTLIGDIVVPNLIVVPFEGETITAVPFQIQGSCDQAEEPNLRVVITHADLGFIEERIPVCIADAWAAPDMGAALWNDDFIVTLNADNFVELPFDTKNFTVDEPGNPTAAPPGSAVQCSGISNLFLEGLCDILAFLFVPNSQTLRLVEDLFDELRDKPPLGFLTVALDAFDTLEQGSSSEELDGTADLSSFFDPIKTTFSALLWMLFAVFLVRRVSTIRI